MIQILTLQLLSYENFKKKLSIKNVVTHSFLNVEFFRHGSMKFIHRLRGLLPQSFPGAIRPQVFSFP